MKVEKYNVVERREIVREERGGKVERREIVREGERGEG